MSDFGEVRGEYDHEDNNCMHVVRVKNGMVLLHNNDDTHFRERFHSRKELHAFIDKLRVAEMEAFGVYPSEDK